MTQETSNPEAVAAHVAVSAFMDTAREALDDHALAIALISAGGGLIASMAGPAEAARLLREAADRIERLEPYGIS